MTHWNKQTMYEDTFLGYISEQKAAMYTMHQIEYQNNESLALTSHGNAQDEIKWMWHDLRSVLRHGKSIVVHTTKDIFKCELSSSASADLMYEEIVQWCRRSQFTGEGEPNCKGFYNLETGETRWVTDIGVTGFMGEQIMSKESTKDTEALLYKTLFVDREQPELHHVCRHMSESQLTTMCISGILDELLENRGAVFYLPDLSSDDELVETDFNKFYEKPF